MAAYDLKKPLNSSVTAVYLVAAVGGIPEALTTCIFKFAHKIQIYSALKTHATLRIGNCTAQCPRSDGRCNPPDDKRFQPPERCQALAKGIEEVKARTLGKSRAEAHAIANEMGLEAKLAWEATQEVLGNGAGVAKTAGGQPKQKPKGKAALNVAPEPQLVDEYDDYSALVYATHGQPTRVVTLVIYHTAGTPPTLYVVFLRCLTAFEFGYFRIAKTVKAVGLDHPVGFQRYSVFRNSFVPETLQPIDITSRGEYMLYKDRTLPDRDCPDIDEWKKKVHNSAAGEPDHHLPTDDEDEDEDEVVIVSSSFNALPSTPSATGSSQPTASKLKRKAVPEFVEGSSKKPKVGAWLDDDEKLLVSSDSE
ncbi:hypothetical protein DFH07DRAFT_964114 [Mycena maculata]|uniref:Uncharacterized protein n=1 Tax=Mycena maculata TaxID=230809 RepID=A0AAD7N307_9AGAR|nr:hypothetical protein DFH07DRAFT_964114 [Mycena maculata]